MKPVVKAYLAYMKSREGALGINPRHVFTAGWDARQEEINDLTDELETLRLVIAREEL